MIREQLAPFFHIKEKSGTFGIEVETEAESYETCYPQYFLKSKLIDTPQGQKAGYHFNTMGYWEGHEDGSLRDFGVEYVLKEPLSFDDTINALEEFRRETKNVKFSKDAPGTSVHVHINMAKESFLTLGNFLTLYTLFENILIEYSGTNRRSNLFALPTRCAEKTFQNIVKMFRGVDKGDGFACQFNIDAVKYAALNLAPLSYFGSVEIRSFRGSTDADEIEGWIRVLNRMVEFSKTVALTPKIIILEWRDRGPEFFDDVFGEEAKELKRLLISRGQPLVEMIEHNLWYASEVAGSVGDWSTISTRIADRQAEKKQAAKKIAVKLKGLPPQPADPLWAEVELAAAGANPLNVVIDDLDEPEGDY